MAASLSLTSSRPPLSPWSPSLSAQSSHSPSASLSMLAGSRTGRRNLSMNVASCTASRSGPLHCSSLSHSSLSSLKSLSSISSFSSFSGLSLRFDMFSNMKGRKKRFRLVVRAGKAALCQTKRNRSRKSLARTHGFRRRMRTTTGRAVLKRRRAKGRWVLCTKSHPNSGK